MKLVILLFVCLVKQVNGQCYHPPSNETPTSTTLNETEGTLDRLGVGQERSRCEWILTPPTFADVLLRINLTRLGTTPTSECQLAGLFLPDGLVHCAEYTNFTGDCFLYTSLSTPSSCQDDITRQTCGNAFVLTENQWPPSIRFVHGYALVHPGFALDYKFINCTADSESTTTSTAIVTTQAETTSAVVATSAITTRVPTSLEPSTSTDASSEPSIITSSTPTLTSSQIIIESTSVSSNNITTKSTHDKDTTVNMTMTQENSNSTTSGLSVTSTTDEPSVKPQFELPIYFYPAIGGAVLLILIVIMCIVMINKRRNKGPRFLARSSTDIIVRNDYVGSNTAIDSTAGTSNDNPDGKSSYNTMDETFIADVPTYATIETGPDALARMTSSNSNSDFDVTNGTWTTSLPTYATIDTNRDTPSRMTNVNAGTEPRRESRSSISPLPSIPSRKPRTHTIEEITHNQTRVKEIRSGSANSATSGSAEHAPYDVADRFGVGTVDVINMTSPTLGLGMAGPDESEYVIMANPNDVNARSQSVYTNESKEEEEDADDFTSDESDDEGNPSPVATNLYAVIKK